MPGTTTVPIPVGGHCEFDTHAILQFQGRIIESITSHGRLFNFEENGSPWPTNGMDLTTVPYFAAGPCAGQTPGHCVLDTRSFALFGDSLIEFVTANGRSWAFDNGVPTDAGTDIASVPRYAEACALRGAGPCRFSTRAFVNLDGQLLETITAYGKYFAYDTQGHRGSDNGIDLTLVPRYAAGPCLGAPFGQCRLDTRTYGVADGQTVEIVTAHGYVWRWLAGGTTSFAEVQPSGVPMTNVASWAGGPCK
jgi:hypothetical protein